MQNKLTHVKEDGKASMVDISNKTVTYRLAKAVSTVNVSEKAYNLLINNNTQKGDVLTVAKIAGIQAAKKCGYIIPLCHPIFISKAEIKFELDPINKNINIYSEVSTNSSTGVEMEALTAVIVTALTIYDMLKSVDKGIKIVNTHLLEKHGGKNGTYYNNK